MSTASYFKMLDRIEDQVTARMVERRQAELDIARHCGGLAFDADNAEEMYRAALEHRGIPRREIAGLDAKSLGAILRNLPRDNVAGRFAHRGSGAAMAFDSASERSPTLTAILKDAPKLRDLSTRNDLARSRGWP